MRPVTVMALHNDDRLQIESVCSAAGVTPARISVAPYALAALIEKSENSPPTLLVSAGHGLAEILILKDDQPVVARTLRLPESDDFSRSLVSTSKRQT
jgi:cell division ATPase FtsA